MSHTHGTDIGPACECASTIYGYDVANVAQASAYCYGCKRVDYFQAPTENATAAQLRAAHTEHVNQRKKRARAGHVEIPA